MSRWSLMIRFSSKLTKLSSVLAVGVTTQHNVVVFRLIVKLNMKESSILVIIMVIKPIENICF